MREWEPLRCPIPPRNPYPGLVCADATATQQPRRQILPPQPHATERFQRSQASQLPPLLLWPGGFRHRNLDAKPGNVLAGAFAHHLRYRSCAGQRAPVRADAGLRTVRRSAGRPGPETRSTRRHPVDRRALLTDACHSDLERPYRSLARLSAGAHRGDQQLVRHAGAASVRF